MDIDLTFNNLGKAKSGMMNVFQGDRVITYSIVPCNKDHLYHLVHNIGKKIMNKNPYIRNPMLDKRFV